jgi:RNA polymerase sigma factor (sigma-70 family)
MPAMLSDLALLAQWRDGDARAGEELFERHYDDVRRFFEHKVGPEGEELVQRTFLGCLESRDQFRGEASFRTYLFSIARHLLFAHLRGARKAAQIDFNLTSLADLGTSPTSRVNREQRRARLIEALRGLPLEQQLLLELHYWHDMDAAALAGVFEVPDGTIRVRLSRARAALRGKLAGIAPDASADRLAAALAAPEGDEMVPGAAAGASAETARSPGSR